jgi:DNA-binding transcriptional regulator LsrR (DeoR family)
MRQEGGTSEDIAAAFGITRNVVDNVLVLARQSGATVLKLKSGPKGSRKAGAMPIAA